MTHESIPPQGMTTNRIESDYHEWSKTITVGDPPSRKTAFSQGYVYGWNAKETDVRSPAESEPRQQGSRPETPTWERRWPHDQPNGWNLNADEFLALVKSAGGMMWLALGRAKYLELRVDTRDCGFNLYDRDGKPLNPDDVVAAVEKVKKDYGAAIEPEVNSQPGHANAWQPIETAPKQERVLLFAPGKNISGDPDEPPAFTIARAADFCWATHWQPLPEGPRHD